MPKGDKLTDKQRLFCLEYLIDKNGTRAAIAAGYSENSASETAYENLRKPQIQAFIQEKIDSAANKLEITAERVLREYAKIAFASMADFLDNWGELKPFNELTDEQKASISQSDYEVITGEGFSNTKNKIKLHDKQRALEALSKHLGLFERDNAQKQPQFSMGNVIINSEGKDPEVR